jgi:hypothetical protein
MTGTASKPGDRLPVWVVWDALMTRRQGYLGAIVDWS